MASDSASRKRDLPKLSNVGLYPLMAKRAEDRFSSLCRFHACDVRVRSDGLCGRDRG